MKRIAIIGGGLAGCSLIHWLLKSKSTLDISLFDNQDPYTASVGPTLLCHPFPGRSLAPHHYLGDAVGCTRELLQDWKEIAPNAIRETYMWRPLKGSNAKRLSKSHRDWWTDDGKHAPENTWLENRPTISACTESDIETHPCFKTDYPTLRTGPAFAIDAGNLFPLVHQHFRNNNVSTHYTSIQSIEKCHGQWCVHSDNGETTCFDQVVLAFGRQTKRWFPHLDITLQGGSLLKARPSSPETIETLSLDGLHVGQHADKDWVFGSTRWSEQPPTPETETTELLQRLTKTLPHSPTMNADISTLWSGIRTIYGSDRLTLCGELPQHRNIFVLTALGSKGFLWGPWTARLLQKRLTQQTVGAEFETVDLMRANAEDGWYSPYIQNSIG